MGKKQPNLAAFFRLFIYYTMNGCGIHYVLQPTSGILFPARIFVLKSEADSCLNFGLFRIRLFPSFARETEFDRNIPLSVFHTLPPPFGKQDVPA
jgi:hypothetical protein